DVVYKGCIHLCADRRKITFRFGENRHFHVGVDMSKECKIQPGEAIAYLIAPPCEAMKGLDAALKAADVELKKFFGPPSETNFAGGLLTGDQAACKAACDAFASQVCRIADAPVEG
ncbi:MAG: BMC domain-containing protein, partial [Oscillibacter sp.]|nr:BMC domain-containing protein [Oscillibacter sp.]